jgi:hypothetical protein
MTDADDNKIVIAPTYVPTQLPVFISDLKLIRPQLQLARQAIEELRVSHPESPTSNVHAAYMSPWKSHYVNDKLIPLCQSVTVIAKEAARRYLSANLDALNMDLVVTDCWGIIYEGADYTSIHNHFPAEFACSVYLEADDNCAPIIFAGHHAVQPKAEMMVLFPGILNHEVPKTPGRRVVIALNLNKVATFRTP